ncbi:MAG: ribonuclease III [Acidobacteria bacterium]|nr:MAG: ribonuclease III [Acidobacteriota bacterium]
MFEDLEQKIQYTFQNKEILLRALTHRSFSHENPERMIKDNETLEFLGDSILGFIISELLFNTYSHQYTEGLMSKVKSYIISTEILSTKAREIGLGQHLLLGRGEEKTGGRGKRSLLANTFEAVIAAIYLDGGLEQTKNFVYRLFKGTMEDVVEKDFHFNDFKSLLQEKLQGLGEIPPDYGVILEEGPHHQKIFHVDIRIRGVAVACGSGSTKKEAEQDAARKAYEQLLSGDLDYLLARRENPVT